VARDVIGRRFDFSQRVAELSPLRSDSSGVRSLGAANRAGIVASAARRSSGVVAGEAGWQLPRSTLTM
jgi:hypothetical protein